MGNAHTLIALIVLLVWPGMSAAHPAHDSYTEIEWNRAGDTLEVSMRIIPEELETALSWRASSGKPVVLENNSVSSPMVEAYLIDTFQIRNSTSELMPLSLVGMDISYKESWLYFTVAASVEDRLTLRNTVLLELEKQQINRVRRLWVSPEDIYLHSGNSTEQLLWNGN